MSKELGAAGLVSRMFAMLAAAGSLAACATAGTGGATSRLPVRSERAVVVVEGRGVVIGGGQIDCHAGSAEALCRGGWTDLWRPSLVATPDPGWTFDHWEWQSPHASIAPGFGGGDGETTEYRAIFVRASGQAVGP